MALHNPDPALLRRQLQSIDDQTERRWIGLALDDGSDAGGAALMESEFADRARWRLLPRNAEADGPYLAFEALLRAAVDLELPVALSDQDDWWHPEKLATLLPIMDEGPSLVFSAMTATDVDGQPLHYRVLGRRPKAGQLTTTELLTMNTVSGCAALLSPTLVRLALPFPRPATDGRHDQWLAALAASCGRVRYCDRSLLRYTIHAAQVEGLGVRRLRSSLPSWLRSVRRPADLRRNLAHRAAWVTASARQSALLADRTSDDLPYVAGRLDPPTLRAILSSVWRRNAPIPRGILLTAGYLLVAHDATPAVPEARAFGRDEPHRRAPDPVPADDSTT